MNKIIFGYFLINILVIGYIHSLTCYSDTLGTTGTRLPLKCADNGFQRCYIITTPFTSKGTITTGAVYNANSAAYQFFIVNDRGCLPGLVSTALNGASVAGQTQTTTAQLLLGSVGSSSTGVLQDYIALADDICFRYGTCCSTDLCNA